MERELGPTREDDWEGVFNEEREEELMRSNILSGAGECEEDAEKSDGRYIADTINLIKKFGRRSSFDGNLPILFGSETELGFRYGKILDPVKSQSFPHFSEVAYPIFLKRIASATSAFVRSPADPWFRSALNHLGGESVQRLAVAAIKNDPPELISDRYIREKLDRGLSASDLYMGEVGVFLPNASRLYIDGGHLEYSIAECRSPREAICLEKAMESLLIEVKPDIERELGRQIFLLKDNTDRKGNSYGCHTNYLLSNKFFEQIYDEELWSRVWASFLVTSIIYTGSGKVGSERGGEPCDYQISQRADHFSRMFGMDTMSNRPIINFRAESLADDSKWGRLHVILHDSNMAEWSIYLKMGVQALALNMMQTHYYQKIENDLYTKYLLRDPVNDFSKVSRDLTCKNPLTLGYGAEELNASPIKIQRVLHDCAKRFYSGCQYRYPCWIHDVLEKWGQILDWLDEDNPCLNSILDWKIKKNIIGRAMEKRVKNGRAVDWNDGAVKDIDGLYHDLGPNGFYNRALKAGLVKRIVSDSEIARYRETAPEDTRASARSQFIKYFLPHLLDVSWDTVVFRLKKNENGELLVEVRLEPLRGTRWMVKDMFSKHASFEAFGWDYVERFLNKKSPF